VTSYNSNQSSAPGIDPELTPSILDIDYAPSHIAELLTAQTNDQERYALAEKMIQDLINERKELLESNENLLKKQEEHNNERKELLNERKKLLEHNDKLLAMSAHQLGKIQALEKQLESVGGHLD
jgi:predicted nuclease with TOPRIM domain